mgnify:CR=1 FL=1|tara:strand:+ start:5288 stop:6493 length:1206 start_codon:yes stop_codon:yes gene_type:complete
MSTRYATNSAPSSTSATPSMGRRYFPYGKVTETSINTGSVLAEGSIRVTALHGDDFPNIAYPLGYTIQQLPLLGEMVPLYYNETLEKLYYGHPINVHNYPTHNSPDQVVIDTPDYEEPSTINPLELFTGDTIIQGRFGQSIRFTQTIPGRNEWSPSDSTLGNPLTIISNGQASTNDGSFLLQESINQDPSSIYLTGNTILPIADDAKRASYGDTPPLDSNTYSGNQIAIKSDRIYLNTREDSILLSAQNSSVGLSGNFLNLDGITSIGLDAPSINTNADTFVTTNQTRTVDSETTTYNYTQFDINGTNLNANYSRIGLGENATDPLLQSAQFLADIATLNVNLTQLATALSGVVALLAVLPGGQAPAALLQTATTTLTAQANTIQTKIGSGTYLSTTVFSK